jgi:hypothetical protein
MKGLVRANKQYFAYSLADLPGYKHSVSIGELTGKPVYNKRRQHSDAEVRVIDEKCLEMRDASTLADLQSPPRGTRRLGNGQTIDFASITWG